ncbi:hypothetical protein Tco_0500547, partial [Tanacetum coccineum]
NKGPFCKRDCWSKTSAPSYQSPFQPRLLHSSEHKPKPRHTKDFKAKYNKVKAKLALLGSSASTPSSSSGKNKGLIFKTYDWDEEEVSSNDNEVTEVKALMALANEERVSVGKESAKNADNSEESIIGSNKPKLSKAEDSSISNHDTGKHPLPPLEKLIGAEPVFGPKTIKSILKLKSTFKAKTLKALASKLKNVKMDDDPCLAIVIKELNELKLEISKNKIISLRRGIKPRNPQHITKNYETYGSNIHTTSDHNDIEWFRKREALQAKKVESFKASKTESSSALRSKTPTKRWVSKQK